MPLITIPSGVSVRPVQHLRLRTRTASPGPGLDGRRQWLSRESRVWVGAWQVLGGWTPGATAWGGWLAFLDDVRGPLNTFVLPVPRYGRTPFAAAGETLFVTDGSGGFLHDDVSGFVMGAGNPTVTTNTPAGATVLAMTGLTGEVLRVDAGFSIDSFYYRVAANSPAGTIRINPPLRAAVTAGAAIEVGAPTIRVRFSDDAAAARAHAFDAVGGAYTIEAEEAFER